MTSPDVVTLAEVEAMEANAASNASLRIEETKRLLRSWRSQRDKLLKIKELSAAGVAVDDDSIMDALHDIAAEVSDVD